MVILKKYIIITLKMKMKNTVSLNFNMEIYSKEK